jgi:hypothetical protein
MTARQSRRAAKKDNRRRAQIVRREIKRNLRWLQSNCRG